MEGQKSGEEWNRWRKNEVFKREEGREGLVDRQTVKGQTVAWSQICFCCHANSYGHCFQANMTIGVDKTADQILFWNQPSRPPSCSHILSPLDLVSVFLRYCQNTEWLYNTSTYSVLFIVVGTIFNRSNSWYIYLEDKGYSVLSLSVSLSVSVCLCLSLSPLSGLVNEKLLSDYLHHVFPASHLPRPPLASLRYLSDSCLQLFGSTNVYSQRGGFPGHRSSLVLD